MPLLSRRHRAAILLAGTSAVLAAGCGPGGAQGAAAAARGIYRPDVTGLRPLTRAERSNFTETSTPQDVRTFLDSLQALDSAIVIGTFGRSADGQEIPYVIASRPLVRTPLEAKALDRPIVFVQGGIHGGEVEGKEALLSIIRDLTRHRGYNVLDTIILIAVPMYNPDGAAQLGPQERNRAEQNGPARIGERANGDSLDLNRDYIKAEAPETRATLDFLAKWDPDVFVDLHTTNGSYHGYAFTWSPPLNPAALVVQGWVRDTVLPELRQRMRVHHRIESFPYGNFVSQDSVERGWFTYDHRPRFGTNYVGLRGRVAVLFEGYSHDDFARRVRTAYSFLYEFLDMMSVNAHDVLDIGREADRRATGWGTQPSSAPPIPIRSEMGPPSRREVMLVENLERTGDSVRTEAGMPPGVRRAGTRRVPVPIHDRFTPTLLRPMPYGYAIPVEYADVITQLARHGIIMEQLQQPLQAEVDRFMVDSLVRDPRRFQKHNTVRLEGTWGRVSSTLPAGTVLVRSGQPRSILAMYLLEPESDDGLVTWNVLDRYIAAGTNFPIVRLTQPVSAPLTVLDR
ncbi:MAG: succinylglutamate desuccinylase/aspartoacylase family protein [Gemmatimonadaceae bacterium]|nr:succinylglutamate desuccinylase/aspartoacylase family protein [Gemmatimonadaceae bacterium]